MQHCHVSKKYVISYLNVYNRTLDYRNNVKIKAHVNRANHHSNNKRVLSILAEREVLQGFEILLIYYLLNSVLRG